MHLQNTASPYYTPELVNTMTPAMLQAQIDYLDKSSAESDADWKFVVMHHPILSTSKNYTKPADMGGLFQIVQKHKLVVLNGHDHVLSHQQGKRRIGGKVECVGVTGLKEFMANIFSFSFPSIKRKQH